MTYAFLTLLLLCSIGVFLRSTWIDTSEWEQSPRLRTWQSTKWM